MKNVFSRDAGVTATAGPHAAPIMDEAIQLRAFTEAGACSTKSAAAEINLLGGTSSPSRSALLLRLRVNSCQE